MCGCECSVSWVLYRGSREEPPRPRQTSCRVPPHRYLYTCHVCITYLYQATTRVCINFGELKLCWQRADRQLQWSRKVRVLVTRLEAASDAGRGKLFLVLPKDLVPLYLTVCDALGEAGAHWKINTLTHFKPFDICSLCTTFCGNFE